MGDDTDHGMPVRYDGGVVFQMTLDAKAVTVRVTDEALYDSEGAARANGNPLAIFGRRRYAIESAARRKFARMREPDGSILLLTKDLNG